MLIAKVTPNAGGFLLAGDQFDLSTLHECLHSICPSKEEDSANPDNLVLQLAHDDRASMPMPADRIEYLPRESK